MAQRFFFGSGGIFSPGRIQWNPTVTYHDPNPPIKLENVNDFLTAETGSYILSGQVAALTDNADPFKLVVDGGVYTLTGQTANFGYSARVVGEQGSYTLSGQAAIFGYIRVILAESGSYSHTGHDVDFRNERMLAEPAEYLFSGRSVNFIFGHAPLVAAQGSYTLAGQVASLGSSLASASGYYTLVGQDVTFNFGALDAAAQGTHTLTGQAAVSGITTPAAAGSYGLTGQDATFNITMVAEAGSYGLTGQVAGLTTLAGQAATGSYGLTGQDVAFRHTYRTVAETGEYGLVGQGIVESVSLDDTAQGMSNRRRFKSLRHCVAQVVGVQAHTYVGLVTRAKAWSVYPAPLPGMAQPKVAPPTPPARIAVAQSPQYLGIDPDEYSDEEMVAVLAAVHVARTRRARRRVVSVSTL